MHWMADLVEFPNFDLADFESPPVVETVLSIQFEKLIAMRAVHLGVFWQKVKERFPKTEEQPVLLPVFDRFPEPIPPSGQIQFEAIEAATVPRVWMINDAGTEVIQIQNDRFIKNWRKSGEHDVYPHYEPVIRPAFQRDFQEFQLFLAEEKLGDMKVTQCEVTYVNHIVSGEGWDKLGEIHKIFRFMQQPPALATGNPEDFAMRTRFPITDKEGHPIGRLHLDVQPARRVTDNRPMYVMNLTARGLYGDGLAFFDIGRQWIVKSFEQLTTEEMHRIWRKK
jgi:uncharacterized protein (TIGR04255 family)